MDELTNAYGFITSSISLLRDGADNVVYMLADDGKKYVARVGKRIDPMTAAGIEDVLFELELIDFLSANGILVPRIVPTQEGNLYSITQYEGKNVIVVVSEFLAGKTFPLSIDTHVPPAIAALVGEELGRYHAVVSRFTPHHTKSRTLTTELDRLLGHASFIETTFENGAEVVQKAMHYKDFLRTEDTRSLCVHNDFRSHNIFWDDSYTHITGVLDLDWACVGDYRKDIAHTALEWAQPDGALEPDMHVFDAIVDGYSRTTPFLVPEKRVLYQWAEVSAFLDACTYWVDSLDELSYSAGAEMPRLRSYMYGKSKYWASLQI